MARFRLTAYLTLSIILICSLYYIHIAARSKQQHHYTTALRTDEQIEQALRQRHDSGTRYVWSDSASRYDTKLKHMHLHHNRPGPWDNMNDELQQNVQAENRDSPEAYPAASLNAKTSGHILRSLFEALRSGSGLPLADLASKKSSE